MTKAPRFDLPDLRLFVEVVHAGSVSAGAARLPLALSAASTRLKQLEHRLDVQLLERHTNGVRLTAVGKIFFDYARRVTQAAHDAQATIDSIQAHQRQRLMVLSNAVGVSTELPTQLAQFLAQNAALDLNLAQRASVDILKAIAAGEGDLGIVDSQYHHDNLLMLPYQRDQLVVLTSQHHVLAKQAQCDFADVAQHPMIAMPEDSSLRRFVERMSVSVHQALNFRAIAPSFGATAQMVAHDLGIAILPSAPAQRYAQVLPVKVVALNDIWATRELHLCMRSDIDPMMPAYELARFLVSQRKQ